MIIQSSNQEGLVIPDEMGKPKKGQLEGTDRERLVELAGRVCYDSLGKGRDSMEYHKHIHDSGHYSVQEHATITLLVEDPDLSIQRLLINRPGIWLRTIEEGHLVTLNPRSVNDWERHGDPFWTKAPAGLWLRETSWWLREVLAYHWRQVAPQLIREEIQDSGSPGLMEIVEPETEDEIHVTCFLQGSRGFSHEQVRHRHRCAISQRSTRYVDESSSTWHWHPLLMQLINDRGGPGISGDKVDELQRCCEDSQAAAEMTYEMLADTLQEFVLKKSNCDKFTARKQARGAARGFLGNALHTELIFTAPVSQWRWMFHMRLSEPADAEIRIIYERLLPQFQERGLLTDLEIRDAADGLGKCLV